MIISAGGSSYTEISNAVNAIKITNNNSQFALLHCISNYPTDILDLNLNTIIGMKENFKIPIGFSDHTIGIHASVSATAIGADLIEKHFTLDKTLDGPDHKLSSDPTEFKELVKGVKIAFQSRGQSQKVVVEKQDTIQAMRRSVSAKFNINNGTIIKENMLSVRRPGGGIQPHDIDRVIGSIAKNNIDIDSIIKWENIK